MAKKSDKEEKYRWTVLEDKIRELVADQGKLENKAQEFEAFMAAQKQHVRGKSKSSAESSSVKNTIEILEDKIMQMESQLALIPKANKMSKEDSVQKKILSRIEHLESKIASQQKKVDKIRATIKDIKQSNDLRKKSTRRNKQKIEPEDLSSDEKGQSGKDIKQSEGNDDQIEQAKEVKE